jgi:flavorubredoxin
MKSQVIFENKDHKWIVFGRDPGKKNNIVDSNQYLIISNGQGFLLDPGGIEIFEHMHEEIKKHIDTKDIIGIFVSHQDPDIGSSIPLWIEYCPKAKVYSSWLWTGFLHHFGMGTKLEITSIPDDGMQIEIGDSARYVYPVPAHYCHSSGNFSLYDPGSKILFSGDIGGALVADSDYELIVSDFDKHSKFMQVFHQRWMPSTQAIHEWVERVRIINPTMICPQHGSIIKGKNVAKFLDWLDSLEVGIWNKEAENNQHPWLVWKNH